jgi:hypothetical protein
MRAAAIARGASVLGVVLPNGLVLLFSRPLWWLGVPVLAADVAPMIGCRVCDATAFKRTKGAAALAVGKLIDVYGSRLVLEAVSDYLRRIGLNVWAHRFRLRGRVELGRDAELHQLRREVKRLRTPGGACSKDSGGCGEARGVIT